MSANQNQEVPKDSTDVGSMERAGDVPGLVRTLMEVRTHSEGGTTSGTQAQAIMAGLGFDILPGASVNIVDMSKVRVIDDSAKIRAEAAHALGRLNNRDGNRALADSLGDRTPLVQQAVVEALCAVGGGPMRELLANFGQSQGFARFSIMEKARALIEKA